MPEESKTTPPKEPRAGDSPALIKSATDKSAAAQDPKILTPEEQMALYEEDLKESDWGHQPC